MPKPSNPSPMSNYPTRIDLVFPTTPPHPLPPAHPYYEPTAAFIQRHGLHIDEAEIWVELSGEGSRKIFYDKDDGEIILTDDFDIIVFQGHLPNEEALEQIIVYTNW